MRLNFRQRFGWALVATALFAPAFTVLPALRRAPSASASAAPADGREVGFTGGGQFIWQSDADIGADLDLAKTVGGTWVRVDVDWPSIQQTGPTDFHWENTDRVIDAARSRGMNVLALVSYTPPWARASGTTEKYPPTNPDDYANFVSAAVARYAPQGVHAWEIWNEPNNKYLWAPKPDAQAYTTLLKKAYTAIHAADPSATVVLGGLSPATDAADGSLISPITFLYRVYLYAGKGYFDAVGYHPYSFPYAPMTVGDWNTFYRTPDLFSLMYSKGDGAKKVWATEWGYPTGTHAQAVSESVQAEYLAQGISQWSAWAFHGPLFLYAPRDFSNDAADYFDNFGLVKFNRSPKASYTRVTQALRAPQSVTATPGSGSATVNWVAPPYDYGNPITAYKVVSSGGENVTVGSSARSAVVPIPNGVARTFTVQAIHGSTPGPVSVPSASLLAGVPTVVPGFVSVTEGLSGTFKAYVPVTLTSSYSATVTVSYVTYLEYPTGFARPDVDFTPVTGTVTFSPGQTSKNVAVTVKSDNYKEPNEIVLLGFSNPTNANMGGFYGLGGFVIVNDD